MAASYTSIPSLATSSRRPASVSTRSRPAELIPPITPGHRRAQRPAGEPVPLPPRLEFILRQRRRRRQATERRGHWRRQRGGIEVGPPLRQRCRGEARIGRQRVRHVESEPHRDPAVHGSPATLAQDPAHLCIIHDDVVGPLEPHRWKSAKALEQVGDGEAGPDAQQLRHVGLSPPQHAQPQPARCRYPAATPAAPPRHLGLRDDRRAGWRPFLRQPVQLVLRRGGFPEPHQRGHAAREPRNRMSAPTASR